MSTLRMSKSTSGSAKATSGNSRPAVATLPPRQTETPQGSQRSRRRCYHLRSGRISISSPGRRYPRSPPSKLAGSARCLRSAKLTVAYSPHAEGSASRFSLLSVSLRSTRKKPHGPFLPPHAHFALPIVLRGHRTTRAQPSSGPTHTGRLLR